MGNELREHPGHSAEYFGDARDYWWNDDYLRLVAERWRLADVRSALDVGAGVGHWGARLGPLLAGDAEIVGVDREPAWVLEATRRAAARGQGSRFRYVEGLAEALPFADDTFDLVTCQTVLIHARDPGAVLGEMIRVARPGGLVAVVEPNNIADSLVLGSTLFDAPIDHVLALVRLQFVCERGKAALGLGNNSIGERIPSMFVARGLGDVQVWMNDRAAALAPPYETPAQRALADDLRDNAAREMGLWGYEETRRYFLAGGGEEAAFEGAWAAAVAERRREAAAIEAGTYSTAGGAITYLVSGRKPAK